MAKVTGLKQLLAKKYTMLDNLPEPIARSFGRLVKNFIMLIWGDSGNGKSNFIMQIVSMLAHYGVVLYVSLEEGTEFTMQELAVRYLEESKHSGKIQWAEADMTYDELFTKLKKKKSPQFIVIDSVQYWDIDHPKYKKLKETFKSKSFIFISHINGKEPDGYVAKKIRYDAGIKVWVEGCVAFPKKSRYGGNKPYVIYEPDAKEYWGEQFKDILAGKIPSKRNKTTKSKTAPRKKTQKPVESEPVEAE